MPTEIVTTDPQNETAIDRWLTDCLVRLAAGNADEAKGTRETLRRQMNEVAADLAGPTPSPVEMMLCRTAAICWQALRAFEAEYAALAPKGMSISQADYHLRRVDGAHRRLMRTLRTLAAVRRAGIPAVQINVARQQVNQQVLPREAP